MTTPWLPDEAALRCYPIVTSGSLFRAKAHLDAVIEQFGVETHPRYKRTPAGITKCSTFFWDVSRAMGCEVAKDFGTPETVYDLECANPRTVLVKRERTMNELVGWLHSTAAANLGWRFVDELAARSAANQGKFAGVVWRNPKPLLPGHGAILRPSDTETVIAQAGASNFSSGPLRDGFGNLPTEFVVHD